MIKISFPTQPRPRVYRPSGDNLLRRARLLSGLRVSPTGGGLSRLVVGGGFFIPLVIHLANWPAEEPRPKKAAD